MLDCHAEIWSILWKNKNKVKIHNTIKDTSIVTYCRYILKFYFIFLWDITSSEWYVLSTSLRNILFCFDPVSFCCVLYFQTSGLRWNSCDLRIQSLNSSYFKSVVAQQEYCNVSCLQQWIEQFSVTHVPDSQHCTCASRFL